MSEEFDHEPIPGLPGLLPPGEQIVWQGQPSWRSLARHTFWLPWLVGYFAVFAAVRGVLAFTDGKGLGGALFAAAIVVPLAAVCLSLLALLAWLNARAAMYTITTRRVVMRFGVALPMTFNLPFKRLAGADLKVHSGGHGDISLELAGADRLAYVVLWPHARPWRFAKAQPMLRSIPEAAKVAALLRETVQAWSNADTHPAEVLQVAPRPDASSSSGTLTLAQAP